jgi:hypothetical protein
LSLRSRRAASANPSCLCRGFDQVTDRVSNAVYTIVFGGLPAEGFENSVYINSNNNLSGVPGALQAKFSSPRGMPGE